MTKAEAAAEYASHGWKVFPCAPNTKIPLAGTHGVKDATCDAAKVAEWWSANPDANIGLACGESSGVWVVDIDIRPEKNVDGIDSVRKSGKRLPDTLKQKTPSGGVHLVYKCDGERPANKNGFLLGVDIRGDGYYIVVAPSVIDGRTYEWCNAGTPLAEFPDDFKARRPAPSVFSSVPPACTVPSTPAIDRARAYLAEIPGAVEHVDGHAKLFWVAQVLVNGFRLSDAEAENLMWNEYNPRCSPPWNRTASTEREFRHKISEAHAKPNPEAVSIYDSTANVSVDDFDYDKCIESIRALLAPKVQTPQKKLTKLEAGINDLLLPDGLVGDIARWMNDTAFCYQPMLSLGASLVLCGAIMGRKVCDESNGRTNLFAMGIGPSSSGKDHPGDCINKILTSAGAQGMMMGRMTSDSAIEKALSTAPSKIAILDEVGHFFSNINSAKSDSFLKTIKPTLMELFTSAHKTYIGKQKASENPLTIDQPSVCIWGVTAPEKLYNGMTIEELQDGWIARNLIFIANNNFPDIVIKPFADVPDSIVESVRSWITRQTGDAIISAMPGVSRKPLVVPMDERARQRFNEFNSLSRERLRKAYVSGDKTQYLWGKALQNARRIALIVACGREYESPVITHYDANYGCRLVEYLIRDTIRAIDENVNENAWDAAKNRIRKIVDSSGTDGIAMNELTRRTQWVKDRRSREGFIDELVSASLIRRIEKSSSVGRPKVVFMSARNADRYEAEQGVEHEEVE